MKTGLISDKQMICLMTLFLLGTSVASGINRNAKQDIWLTLLAAAIAIIPILLIYARLTSLFPGKSITEILFGTFGKLFGWIVTFIFFIYCFQHCVLILTSFIDMVSIIALQKTPKIITGLIIMILCAYTTRKNINVLSRGSLFLFVFIISIIIITTVLLVDKLDFANLMPMLSIDSGTFISSALHFFSFPFAESIVLLSIVGFLSKETKMYRVFMIGLAITVVLLLISILRNLLTLGPTTYSELYSPSNIAVSVINIGDFFQRIEALIESTLIFCVFVKICICLYASCVSAAKLFGVSDHNSLVYPFSLLITVLSVIVFTSSIDIEYYTNHFYIWQLPVQVGLPIILWITAEIRNRICKAKGKDLAVSG